MHLLRIRIYQPSAHYRIPFTYQRRHTYPLPPYSTVIGFLINVMGIYDQRSEVYQEGIKKLKISIAGRFASKTTEYIWFRNLSKSAHIERFGYSKNRVLNGDIEHPGGQSPVRIDVLNDIILTIYLGHNNNKFIEKISNAIINPENRLEPIHLGRAEDWIVLFDKPQLIDTSQLFYDYYGGNFHHFFWIPKTFYVLENNQWETEKFDVFEGLLYNLPSFCKIEGYEKSFNRHGMRKFEFVRTKLNDGLLIKQKLLIDTEINLPIFLGELNGKN